MNQRDDDYECEEIELEEGVVAHRHHGPSCPRFHELRAERRGKRKEGPAQVANEAYRSGWDVTFGGKPAVRGVA